MAKIKRSVSMILSVLMAASVLTTAPVSAATVEASDAGANVAEALQAELKIAEGSCGDKLTWTLGNDGVLEISGEGKMYDFDFEAKEGENSFNPWTLYRDQIKKVVVNDGVEYIGNFAFFGFAELEEVEISDSVKEIGENAFEGCDKLDAEAFTEPATEEETTEAVVEETTKNSPIVVKEEEEAVGAGTVSVANCSVRLSVGSYLYDGTAKKPSASVYYGSTKLVKNTDFTISYKNNINVGTATATITGKGNYYGTKSVNFVISNTTKDFTKCNINLVTDSVEYDGSYQQPGVIVKDGTKTLVNNSDYSLSYNDCVKAGIARVTITGRGIYKGSVTKNFTITKRSVENVTIIANDVVYNGRGQYGNIVVKDGDKVLRGGEDYGLSYKNNVNAGTAEVTVIGLGNYEGRSNATYTIAPKPITDCTVTIDCPNNVYDGNTKNFTVTVKDGDKVLEIGKDYTINGPSIGANAGKKTIYITGQGNYSGIKPESFEIAPKPITECTVTVDCPNNVYDGNTKNFTVTVKDGDKVLETGKDYTINGPSIGANAGTKTIYITGQGNYSGIKPESFEILPKSLNDCDVSLYAYSFVYSGSGQPCHPVVTIKNGTKDLRIGTDYSVNYQRISEGGKYNDPGQYKVTITGKGNYKDIVYQYFEITPRPISEVCTLTVNPSANYDSRYSKSFNHVAVKFSNGTNMAFNQDYVINYIFSADERITAVITGKGYYSGTINFTYKPTQNNSFTWGTDNWSFNNTSEYFKNRYINEQTIDALSERTYISAATEESYRNDSKNINNKNSTIFGGSCYGMSVSSIVASQGYLSLSSLGLGLNDTVNSNIVPLRSTNTTTQMGENTKSVINFFHSLQTRGISVSVLNSFSQQYSSCVKQDEFISRIEAALKDGNQKMTIGYGFKKRKDKPEADGTYKYTTSGHCVVGYGIEDCYYTDPTTGKTYDKRILTYDPNFGSANALTTSACIYYRSDDHSWVVPYWNSDTIECYWNPTDTEKIGYIQSAIIYHSMTSHSDVVLKLSYNYDPNTSTAEFRLFNSQISTSNTLYETVWYNNRETNTCTTCNYNMNTGEYSEMVSMNPSDLASSLKNTISANEEYSQGMAFGDLNNDKTINIKDVTLLSRYVNGLAVLNMYQLEKADINGDGIINSDDVTTLQISLLA